MDKLNSYIKQETSSLLNNSNFNKDNLSRANDVSPWRHSRFTTVYKDMFSKESGKTIMSLKHNKDILRYENNNQRYLILLK